MKLNPRRAAEAATKFLAASVLMTASAGVAWASCGGTEALVTSAITSLQGMVLAQVASVEAAMKAMENYQSEQMTGSMKVMAKQMQVSAEQRDSAMLEAEQAGASVAVDLANKEMVDKAILDYTSQGFNPCYQLTENKRMVVAEATVQASIPTRISSEMEAGGGRYASMADTLAKRDQQHRALFCTQSEVDAGICSSLGAIPGGDVNASMIFSTDVSPNAIAAKNAAINNIIGVPDEPLTAAAAGTPQGLAYVLQKKEKDALLAFPTYSLKSIQAEGEGFDSVLASRVGQYFGTSQAEAWAKDQASQGERGVVLDMVKLNGLSLKIGLRELQQSMRREANAAVELALENKRINGAKTEAAQAKALASQALAKVAQ